MTIPKAPPCPDDRLALAARGAIDAAEWETLRTHLDTCTDCTVAWIAARAFDGSAGAEPADERLVRGAARAALATVGASSRPRRALRSAAAAAAAVILLATAASAGVFIGRRSQRAEVAVDHGTTAARDEGRDRRVPGSRPAPAIAPAPAPAATDAPVAPLPSAPSPPVASLPSAPSPRSSRAALGVGPPDGAVGPSRARALFARATAARQAGRVSEAIALFQRLDAEWPQTPEAIVSRVSLGDLLAARGDAPGALASFDAYLGAAPTGPLVPEALAARARLLSRLGRTEEARRSWDELGRRFPDSPYLSRQHARGEGALP